MGNTLGWGFTVNMEENFKKNQEFIQLINKIKMERQIQLQFQMAERARAVEIAHTRELTNWLCAFYVTAAVGLFTGFRRTKRTYLLAPMIPLTFITLYHLDAAYGNKIHRIRMEAEHILNHEMELLEVPCGLPTPSSIDLGRLDAEEKVRLHPHPI